MKRAVQRTIRLHFSTTVFKKDLWIISKEFLFSKWGVCQDKRFNIFIFKSIFHEDIFLISWSVLVKEWTVIKVHRK